MKYKFVIIVTIVLLCFVLLVAGAVYYFNNYLWVAAEQIGRMKLFDVTLANYLHDNGSLPRSSVLINGNLHSWRIMILPLFGEKEISSAYRFDEPWNGVNNSKFLDKMPLEFCSPLVENNSYYTNYVLPCGEHMAWHDGTSKFKDIKDNKQYTILVAELLNSDINWLEPRDLEIDKIQPSELEKMFQGACYVNAMFFVSKIPLNTPYKVIHAMFTIDGGEKIYETENGELKIME